MARVTSFGEGWDAARNPRREEVPNPLPCTCIQIHGQLYRVYHERECPAYDMYRAMNTRLHYCWICRERISQVDGHLVDGVMRTLCYEHANEARSRE